MTGSFPKTSAVNILIIPELTLSHVLTAEMSSSMGECQRREAVLIWEGRRAEVRLGGRRGEVGRERSRKTKRKNKGRREWERREISFEGDEKKEGSLARRGEERRRGKETNRVDEPDARKVHVVVSELFEDIRVVDRFGTEVLVTLRKREKERRERRVSLGVRG